MMHTTSPKRRNAVTINVGLFYLFLTVASVVFLPRCAAFVTVVPHSRQRIGRSSSSSSSSSRIVSTSNIETTKSTTQQPRLGTITTTATSRLHASGKEQQQQQQEQQQLDQTQTSKKYNHGLAILRMPLSCRDRIANEAILETALRHTDKLSVVLRSAEDDDDDSHSLASLRRYVSEVYSMLWDCSTDKVDLNNVVVYPQNLPNAAPEQWIHHYVPDLDMVCSHDSITGWYSEAASGRGTFFLNMDGQGGLDDHVAAMNADRTGRGLGLVEALHVNPWPKGACLDFAKNHAVVFMDDDEHDENEERNNNYNDEEENENTLAVAFASSDKDGVLLGGARIQPKTLYQNVCVGGTFDGMHYGHRKLLTLAVSSVLPQTGRLLVGVTIDDMLKNKKYAELIPPLQERIAGVREFLDRLAPGMKNRVKIVPISDPYGPPGNKDEGSNFDALVLSHETLENGHLLNEHRVKLGMKPLILLCTRRTEAYGMSSTALRKRRSLSMAKEMQ